MTCTMAGVFMAAAVSSAARAADWVYHLVAGIRHLVWDTGRGLEKAQSQRSAWVVIGPEVRQANAAVAVAAKR